MIVEESRYVKRIYGRLDEGKDFFEQMQEVLAGHEIGSGVLQVQGSFGQVSLVRYNSSEKAWETILDAEGTFEVVQMQARILKLGDNPVVNASVLLATKGPMGQQLLYGQLRSAMVESMDFMLEVPNDLDIVYGLDAVSQTVYVQDMRRLDVGDMGVGSKSLVPMDQRSVSGQVPNQRQGNHGHKTHRQVEGSSATVASGSDKGLGMGQSSGLESGSGSQPTSSHAQSSRLPSFDAENASSESTSGVSWSQAADVSRVIRQEKPKPMKITPIKEPDVEDIYADIDLEEPLMAPGDTLLHRELGKCRVVRVQEDDIVHVRASRGKIRKLNLGLLDVEYVEAAPDGSHIFKASMPRP